MRPTRSIPCAGALATLAVTVAACGGASKTPVRPTITPAPTPSKAQVIAHVRNAVAQITGKSQFGTVSGTLTIINADKGLAITNAHVVESLTQIQANFGSKGKSPAVVVGVMPCADLALVHIKDVPAGTGSMPFADPGSVTPGAPAMTAGYPASSGSGSNAFVTITSGSVTADAVKHPNLGPALNVPDLAIQTDATINPGNSGGPLFNDKGQILGINTYSDASQDSTYFAIAGSVVQKDIPTLMQGEKGTGMGLTPVRMLDVGGLLRDIFAGQISSSWARWAGHEVKREGGLLVTAVEPDSAADKAGIKVGMWITEMNGVKVQSVTNSCRTLESIGTDESVKVTGWHLFDGSLNAAYTKSLTRSIKNAG